MSDIAISVENLGKQYRLGQRERYDTLRDALVRAARMPMRWLSSRMDRTRADNGAGSFWALRDVSFQVPRGEVVGIIGRNGAGKSTLLKILSQITEPTTGQIDLSGRVASLLEVGTGFHPELTGRENVFLNGAILGMKRPEIIRKFDEIIAFAEVEKFIDTPVKHYSSGMYMRLAFAVAAHLEPEILVVDEVLAVGDAEFQRKCLGRMSEVARGGRTVLFVSHNMAAVQSLCGQAVLLERGRIESMGPAPAVVQSYLHSTRLAAGQFNAHGRRGSPAGVEIIDARVEKNGAPVESLLFGEAADVVLSVRVKESVRFGVELLLRQQDGLPVAFGPSGLARCWDIAPGLGTHLIRCRLPAAQLAAGTYSIDLIAAISGTQILDYIESGLTFDVDSAAIGARCWAFRQAQGQGCFLWEVDYQLEGRA